MGLPALLASALCTFVLPLLLFLAATKLWYLYCVSSRDRSCALPLPPGTMGFPFFGETLQMVLQVRELGKGPENFPEDFPPQLWAWAEAGISVLAREATMARRGVRRRPDAPRRPLTRFAGLSLPPHSQRRKFLQMKRRKYGFIYKTHLFGRPTVRVMGADNVRRILLGEHRLVAVQWPASVRTILGSGCLSNLHDSSHKQRKKVRAR